MELVLLPQWNKSKWGPFLISLVNIIMLMMKLAELVFLIAILDASEYYQAQRSGSHFF